MSPVAADLLEVHHHDDRKPTVYRNVDYWLWRDGVTVFRDGVEIGGHDDVLRTVAE